MCFSQKETSLNPINTRQTEYKINKFTIRDQSRFTMQVGIYVARRLRTVGSNFLRAEAHFKESVEAIYQGLFAFSGGYHKSPYDPCR